MFSVFVLVPVFVLVLLARLYVGVCRNRWPKIKTEYWPAICQFWWSQQEDEHRAHWISWEKMMRPKEEGGLGFRDLHSFNLAMLARQGWRLIQSPNSLCSKVLRAKYFEDGDILNAKPVPGMSYV
jgi:hypothetical protein